jgi:RNA-directed DNA polymerase
VISPLLANIYLHYVFDLWAARWRRREATCDMVIVRYADGIVVGFEHEAYGRRFLDMMRERLAEFALTLHPEKTRLITFGRLAAAQRAKLGSANRKRSISLASLISADRPGRAGSKSAEKVGGTADGQSCGRSRTSYAGACCSPSPSKGDG